MHYKEAKNILSINNGMNIYRGCSHGCIYCDSRSKCYNINPPFEDIEVKSNAPLLLEKKLKSKKSKCMIKTGSMSDPYIPLEDKIKNTHECLEIIKKYGFGISIQTKSNLILKDLDLLIDINKQSKCIVQMTMTTFDEKLCKIIEPNVCTTKERFEVLKIMHNNNIKTIVWLSPILPFINDTIENLDGILNYCIEAKVYGIICFGFGLTLRDGNREYFYQKLDEYFPGMKQKYIKKYGNSYEVNSPNNDILLRYFYDKCKKHNIICNNNELFQYIDEFTNNEQLILFI